MQRSCQIAMAALLAVLLAAPVTATAQVEGATEDAEVGAALSARREALFVATLNDPTNLDIAFEYALLSAQMGDFEAAIATLERMLVFAPGLPRVQLELAALYYRIGAPDTARYYLDAVRAQDLPPDVRARVERFAVAVARDQRPWVLTGTVSGGLQVQSNATAAPNDDVIIVRGIPVTLNDDARAAGDANLFGLANVHFSHELPGQGDLLEVDFTSYGSKYFEQSRLDLGLVELAVGPSFSLGRVGLDRMRFGVYGIGALVALDGNYYAGTYGLGLRLRTGLGERAWLDTRYELRAVNYENSETYPTVRSRTGREHRIFNQVTALIGPQVTAAGAFEARYIDARVAFDSFWEFAFTGRATYRFAGPTDGPLADDVPWSASLAAGAVLRRFDGPDPFIDPANAQEDDAFWVEAGLSVPLEQDFSAFITGQYRVQTSNYPTRDFDNAILTVGVSKRF